MLSSTEKKNLKFTFHCFIVSFSNSSKTESEWPKKLWGEKCERIMKFYCWATRARLDTRQRKKSLRKKNTQQHTLEAAKERKTDFFSSTPLAYIMYINILRNDLFQQYTEHRALKWRKFPKNISQHNLPPRCIHFWLCTRYQRAINATSRHKIRCWVSR